jgi:hypothetical protein
VGVSQLQYTWDNTSILYTLEHEHLDSTPVYALYIEHDHLGTTPVNAEGEIMNGHSRNRCNTEHKKQNEDEQN